MIARTKTLIAARQKKLREYIKETNKMYGKKYDILTRDYVREQVDTKYLKNDKKIFLKKRLTINIDKQNVHLQGTMEYNRRVEQGKDPNYKYYGTEPSYFTISVERLDEIVKENINLSKIGDRFQFIDANEVVGVYKRGDIVSNVNYIVNWTNACIPKTTLQPKW